MLGNIKMYIFKIIVIIIIINLSSCNGRTSNLNFEKKVMNQIFIELIDSLYFDPEYIPPPPMPLTEIYFSTSNQKLKDSIYKKDSLDYLELIAEFEKRVKKIKSYSGKIVIAVNDTVHAIDENRGILLTEHFENIDYDINNEIGYIIDLKEYSTNQKYKFKYASEFPKDSEIWKGNYGFHLSSVVSFSRIQFDKTKNYGVLTGGITYGKLSGYGVIIYIKKESNKWTIDEIVNTWIS